MSLSKLDDYIKRKVKGLPLDPNEEMMLELMRIVSYIDWPKSSQVSPIGLAKAGFFKSGSHQVTCCSCKLTVSDWGENDIPLEKHCTLSPQCKYVVNVNKNLSDPHVNVPMGTADNELSLRQALASVTAEDAGKNEGEAAGYEGNSDCISDEDASEDEPDSSTPDEAPRSSGPLSHESPVAQTCRQQPRQHSLQPQAMELHHQETPMQATSTVNTFAKQGYGSVCDGPQGPGQAHIQDIINHIPPTHRLSQQKPQPDSTDPRKRADFAFFDRMRSETERLATFYDFPERAWQTPASLAAAGFFYTGNSDCTKCAFCRGILRNWEPNDVPMNEHKRHFGECPFVNGRDVGNIPKRTPKMKKGSSRHSTAGSSTSLGSPLPSVPDKDNQSPGTPDHNAAGLTFRIEPKEIKARLDTPMVKTILGLGHSGQVVRMVIDERLRTTGDDFVSAKEMMEAVLAMEEKLKSKEQNKDELPQAASMQGACSIQANTADIPIEASPTDSCKATKSQKRNKKKGAKKQRARDPAGAEANPLDVGRSELTRPKTEGGISNDKPEYNDLVQQHEEMTERRQCKVCMSQEACLLFLPCSHLVCCTSCAPALRNCPICREPIKGTIHINKG